MSFRRRDWSVAAAAIGWTAILAQAIAQIDSSASGSLQAADADLNATYRSLTTALPPRDRERLRSAERAWVAFIEKNQAAFTALAAKRNMPPSRLNAATIAETQARHDTLRLMLDGASDASRDQLSRQLEQADSELNAAYKDCVAALDNTDISMLRDAQRAWITFRDAQARTKNALTTSLMIINYRTAQLREFYLGDARTTTATSEQLTGRDSLSAQNSSRKIPDPFERAR